MRGLRARARSKVQSGRAPLIALGAAVALIAFSVAGCGSSEETDEKRLQQEAAEIAFDLCYTLEVDELAAALGTDATTDDVSRAAGRRAVGTALLFLRDEFEVGEFDLPPRAVTDRIARQTAGNCRNAFEFAESAQDR